MARKTVLRHKDIVISASLAVLDLAAVVLVQVMVILPPTSLAKAREAELTKAIKEIDANGKKERDLKALERDNAELRTQLGVFEARVPTKTEIPAVFAEILKLADQNDLKILYTQPKDSTLAGQGFHRFPYEIELVGNYHAIGEFISRMESHAHFIQVVKTDFSGSPEGAVRMKLLLNLYGTVMEVADRAVEGAGAPEAPPATSGTGGERPKVPHGEQPPAASGGAAGKTTSTPARSN